MLMTIKSIKILKGTKYNVLETICTKKTNHLSENLIKNCWITVIFGAFIARKIIMTTNVGRLPKEVIDYSIDGLIRQCIFLV